MSKKYFFIINPVAGMGKKLSFVAEITDFCQQNNLDYRIEITKRPKHATEMAQRAAKKYEVVVAVGGDGTVNEVVNGIAGTQAVLGILPIGSGNDYSRQLGYKKSLKKDLEILQAGRLKRVNVGVVNNEFYFINGFGIGFDGTVATKVKSLLPYIKGFAAYLIMVLKTLPFYQFPQVSIELDGRKIINKKILVVATCIGTTYGGGFNIAPSAKLDDGFFTVCVIDKLGRAYALRSIPRIMKGAHLSMSEVHTYTTKKIVITSEKQITNQLDGELLPLLNKYSINMVDSRLQVITG